MFLYYGVDVLFLIEIFLKFYVFDFFFEIFGFVLYRKDRFGNKKGGGIFVFVLEKLKVRREYNFEEMSLKFCG